MTADWKALARKLDWAPTYVDEAELFPVAVSGTPWLAGAKWRDWEEPYKTTFGEYVREQHAKDAGLAAVQEALAGSRLEHLDPGWLAAMKLHAATLPLAEFTAVIGNLRAARFGRDTAWRTTAAFGALDELRHTQIPLLLMHELLKQDHQFEWTHRFYHTNNWVAIAARHAFDELLLTANPIELAIGTNFVFETGFTNLQFIGLSAAAARADDRVVQSLLTSIQTDEARHAQIGRPVLEVVMAEDPAYAQYLVDKWFWRSFQLFAIVTGFALDYLAPLGSRGPSFKEFVEEWVLDQFLQELEDVGLERPWYWEQLLQALDYYHHMVYASAYSYRASVWFDFVLPGPDELEWLDRKYPDSWAALAPIWERITTRWRESGPGLELAVHGHAIPTFCALCQIVLCHGTPARNAASVVEQGGVTRIFCSEPCRWIFEREPERYSRHKDVVHRVLAGQAPANLVEFLTRYSGLEYETWGKDAYGGSYPWMDRRETR